MALGYVCFVHSSSTVQATVSLPSVVPALAGVLVSLEQVQTRAIVVEPGRLKARALDRITRQGATAGLELHTVGGGLRQRCSLLRRCYYCRCPQRPGRVIARVALCVAVLDHALPDLGCRILTRRKVAALAPHFPEQKVGILRRPHESLTQLTQASDAELPVGMLQFPDESSVFRRAARVACARRARRARRAAVPIPPQARMMDGGK